MVVEYKPVEWEMDYDIVHDPEKFQMYVDGELMENPQIFRQKWMSCQENRVSEHIPRKCVQSNENNELLRPVNGHFLNFALIQWLC